MVLEDTKGTMEKLAVKVEGGLIRGGDITSVNGKRKDGRIRGSKEVEEKRVRGLSGVERGGGIFVGEIFVGMREGKRIRRGEGKKKRKTFVLGEKGCGRLNVGGWEGDAEEVIGGKGEEV